MKPLFELLKPLEVKKSLYKNRRDEIISLMTLSINRLREGTEVKPTTKRLVALRANRNPYLSKSDSELEYVMNECLRKGSFSYFYYITK